VAYYQASKVIHSREAQAEQHVLTISTADAIQVILYHYVLWAEKSEKQILITYAKRAANKDVVRPEVLTLEVDEVSFPRIDSFVHKLLKRAYGKSQIHKRIKVLINPYGGSGKARKYYSRDIEPIFKAAKCYPDALTTLRGGHAVELAEELDLDRWDVVACCSGDGLPYEVFNGLAQKKNAKTALGKLAVVQLPCGTGNAMSLNLNGTDSPSMAALAVVKGIKTPIDLVSITQGERRTLSFLSQSVGIVAESDLGTENMRWMGSARFTIGFLQRLLGKTLWPVDLAVGVEIEDKSAIRSAYKQQMDTTTTASKLISASSSETGLQDSPATTAKDDEGLPPLRFGTINDPIPSSWTVEPYPNLGNFYAGNMAWMAADTKFFPAAMPNDGCIDLVTIDGDIPRMTSIKLLLAVENGKHFDQEVVRYRKVNGFRLVPRQPNGYISIDGERVPFEGFQAEVHQSLGCTLSRSGKGYESSGPI
jgi:sphingosine kinase